MITLYTRPVLVTQEEKNYIYLKKEKKRGYQNKNPTNCDENLRIPIEAKRHSLKACGEKKKNLLLGVRINPLNTGEEERKRTQDLRPGCHKVHIEIIY